MKNFKLMKILIKKKTKIDLRKESQSILAFKITRQKLAALEMWLDRAVFLLESSVYDVKGLTLITSWIFKTQQTSDEKLSMVSLLFSKCIVST